MIVGSQPPTELASDAQNTCVQPAGAEESRARLRDPPPGHECAHPIPKRRAPLGPALPLLYTYTRVDALHTPLARERPGGGRIAIGVSQGLRRALRGGKTRKQIIRGARSAHRIHHTPQR